MFHFLEDDQFFQKYVGKGNTSTKNLAVLFGSLLYYAHIAMRKNTFY